MVLQLNLPHKGGIILKDNNLTQDKFLKFNNNIIIY